MPTVLELRKLKTQVVTAYHAWLCCTGEKARISKFLLEMADLLEDSYDNTFREGLAPRPVPATLPLIFATRTSPRILGLALSASGAAFLATVGVPATSAELQAAVQPLRAAADVITQRASQGCYDCVKKRTKRQDRAKKQGQFVQTPGVKRTGVKFTTRSLSS